MNNIATLPANDQTKRQLALIRRTVAADTNEDEFDMFISMARALKLDPLRKQIYCFVFSKDDPKKRKMAIITAIDGFRSIADRTGAYRPDEDEPTYEIDESLRGPLNPMGLVKASVRVWKFSHGGWHKATGVARWAEYAPIKDEWAENDKGKWRPTGEKTLDISGNWGKMPFHMLAKVAEALALRKAWPDDFSGAYVAEEMDRAIAIDMSPSEMAAAGATEARMEKIGASANALTIDWLDNKELAQVPVGQLADRAMAFIRDHKDEPSMVGLWQERNRHSLREFWAHAPGDAFAVKAEVEKAMAVAGGGE